MKNGVILQIRPGFWDLGFGLWWSQEGPGFLKFPLTLVKKSKIKQKFYHCPLENLDFRIGCTKILTNPIKVKPNQAKLIQNTQK